MKIDAKIISESSVTVIIGGKPYTMGSKHPKFKEAIYSVKSGNPDQFLKLYNTGSIVKPTKDFGVSESVLIGYDTVTYKGIPVHNVVSERLIKMQSEGHDCGPLCKFLEKLLRNPSKWCVDALYKFMESRGLPITEEGNVLGYKCVKFNYMDKYSGKFLNNVGSVHSIERNTVDDDRSKECSYGFHIGDLEYSGPNGSYYNNGDKIVICEFSPEDVVAVPEEAEAHKIRVCKYKVVSEYKNDLPDTFHNTDIEGLTPGDIIEFILVIDNPDFTDDPDDWQDSHKDVMIRMKFEGISKRAKLPRFFGRYLKGTEFGIPGQSCSFLISEIYDLIKV